MVSTRSDVIQRTEASEINVGASYVTPCDVVLSIQDTPGRSLTFVFAPEVARELARRLLHEANRV